MANITVKKFDGTTDVIYTAATPSAGDGSMAIWKNQTIVGPIFVQPELRLASVNTKDNKKRRLRGTFVYPESYTDTATGLVMVRESVMGSFDFTLGKATTASTINEASAQFTNLIASALMKASLSSGYAPS